MSWRPNIGGGLLICLGLERAAQAAVAVGETPLPDAGASLFRVLGALALVLALFFGGVWAFRNWPRLTANSARSGKLKILESRTLGQRQALYVLAYEKERLLIAVSPAAVSLLIRLPEAPEGAADPPAAPVSFRQALRQIIERKP